MHRSYYLSKKHYASSWQARDLSNRNDRTKVNKVAYEFATTKNIARKEELQLWLLECFHSYLLKYLNMIIFGQLPPPSSPQGKDAQSFLKLLLNNKKNQHKASYQALTNSCKTLHLAFKEQSTTDEVYDALVLLFLRVCAHYDPLYPKKTEKVCKYIENQPAIDVITIDDIAGAVRFDPIGCIRILVRGGYLASIQGPRKSILGYQRGPNWPPAPKFFQVSSMGFTGFAPRFFRWYLRNYILDKMGELESTEHILQLDHIPINQSGVDEDGVPGSADRALPSAEGSWTDHSGTRWAADVKLMEHWKALDVSHMDEAWIHHTDDFLFKELSKKDRWLLYLVFVKELTWVDIADLFHCDQEAVADSFNKLMIYLADRAKITHKLPKDV